MSYLKDNIFNVFSENMITFFLKNLLIFFSQFIRKDHLRHQIYKNKKLNNTQVLKVKNNNLELENYIKPINISINDTDEFQKKELFVSTKTIGTIATIV